MIHISSKLVLFLTLFISFASALNISAKNEQNNIVKVLIKDGNTLSFEFDEEPTFKLGSSIIINTNSYEVVGEYAYGQILKIYFDTDNISGIKEASTSTFRLANNKLYVENIANDACINVYSIDGKSVSTDIERRDNSIIVSLCSLSRGTYIVKINNLSFKILKK